MPIAKVLKRGSVIIRFLLHAQQNDDRSAERAGIKNGPATDEHSPFEVHWSRQGERESDGRSR
jgi:hypothetical protein